MKGIVELPIDLDEILTAIRGEDMDWVEQLATC